MTREGILNRKAYVSKTTRGKSNEALEYNDVEKLTSIEGLRCGLNGGQE